MFAGKNLILISKLRHSYILHTLYQIYVNLKTKFLFLEYFYPSQSQFYTEVIELKTPASSIFSYPTQLAKRKSHKESFSPAMKQLNDFCFLQALKLYLV